MNIEEYIKNRAEYLIRLNDQNTNMIEALKINGALNELIVLLDFVESKKEK